MDNGRIRDIDQFNVNLRSIATTAGGEKTKHINHALGRIRTSISPCIYFTTIYIAGGIATIHEGFLSLFLPQT
jgi:hypothetical protein